MNLSKVVLGSYTFTQNPHVEDISREFFQDTAVGLDGTTLVSYLPVPDPGSPGGIDTSRINSKRVFKFSGIDPDIDQIELIEAELEKAPPLNFTDTMGNSYQVVLVSNLEQSVKADSWKTRDYSFTVREI